MQLRQQLFQQKQVPYEAIKSEANEFGHRRGTVVLSGISFEKKFSRNTLTVLKMFEQNPFEAYCVEDIVRLAEEYSWEMGQRSIYRAIERLVNARKIVCTSMKDGCRQYQLANTGCLDMKCKSCGSKTSIRVNEQNKLMEEIYTRYQFDIISISAEYFGICNCAPQSE